MLGFLGQRSARAAGSVLGTLVLLGSHSLAQVDPDELARRHFESGAAYFEQAEYEEALQAFQKAYELSQRATILRNISIVQERLGNLAGAVAALDQFLEKAPDEPAAETIRLRRDNLRARLEARREQEARNPQPDPRPDNRKEMDESDDEPANDRAEKTTLPPEEGSLPEEPNLVPAYILLSVGGLTGAGALLTGVVAKLEHDALSTSCKPECTNSEVTTGESLALTSTILTGVSVVTLGAGLIWWATADSEQEASVAKSGEALPSVSLGVTPEAGFAEARWRF